MNIYPDAESTKNQDGVLLVDFDPQGHPTAGCHLETLYTRSESPLAAGRVAGVNSSRGYINPGYRGTGSRDAGSEQLRNGE